MRRETAQRRTGAHPAVVAVLAKGGGFAASGTLSSQRLPGAQLLVVAAVLAVGAALSYHLRKLREEIRGRAPAGGAGARGRREWPAEWLDGSANHD